MKPRKKVLLLARNDVDLSLWSMRLDVAARYAVLAATTPEEARVQLAKHPDCSLVLTQWAAEPVIGALRRQGRKVLLFDCDRAEAAQSTADGYEVAGPALVARVLERARGLLACRRGPKPRVEFEEAA